MAKLRRPPIAVISPILQMCPHAGISKSVPASNNPMNRYSDIVATIKASNADVNRFVNEGQLTARSDAKVAIKRAVYGIKMAGPFDVSIVVTMSAAAPRIPKETATGMGLRELSKLFMLFSNDLNDSWYNGSWLVLSADQFNIDFFSTTGQHVAMVIFSDY